MPENIADQLAFLNAKDSKEAYAVINSLVKLAETEPILYPYTPLFVSMVASDKYVIRVRGFRLLCKQAQWDTDQLIDASLAECFQLLNDDKPTAVRQALAALHDVVTFKPALRESIWNATASIDVKRYREDTMRPIIEKDIALLQEAIIRSKGDGR